MAYTSRIPIPLLHALRGDSKAWLRNLPYETVFWVHSKDTSTTLLAIGEERSLRLNALEKPFEQVDTFLQDQWTFTCLSYDLKNAVEDLEYKEQDPIGIPDLLMVRPQWVLKLHGGHVTVCKSPEGNGPIQWNERPDTITTGRFALEPRVSKERYLTDLDQILAHIQRGDIYEINYCQEYHAENVAVDPGNVFDRLYHLARAPHSAYVRWKGRHVMCASPERFFKKKGAALISQPIKGTAPRYTDPVDDKQSAKELLASEKERSENVMITDLVRNDISRIARRGTVGVDELFGIYSFPTVHQMISTIRGEVRDDCTWEDIFKALFPMGSMTGAPKVSAMQIIDKLEPHRRGIYSGSIGYIDREGNADFNVVIRTLIYNATTGYLSASAGGAITTASDPKKEYEESMLKLQVLFQALKEDHSVNGRQSLLTHASPATISRT